MTSVFSVSGRLPTDGEAELPHFVVFRLLIKNFNGVRKVDAVPGPSTNRKARQKVQKDLGLAVEMVENFMSSNILRMRHIHFREFLKSRSFDSGFGLYICQGWPGLTTFSSSAMCLTQFIS